MKSEQERVTEDLAKEKEELEHLKECKSQSEMCVGETGMKLCLCVGKLA